MWYHRSQRQHAGPTAGRVCLCKANSGVFVCGLWGLSCFCLCNRDPTSQKAAPHMCGLGPARRRHQWGKGAPLDRREGTRAVCSGGLLLPFLLRTLPPTPTPTQPLLSHSLSLGPGAQARVWRHGPPTGRSRGAHDGLEVRGAGRGAHRHPRELGDAPLEVDGEVRTVGAELLQHARGRPHRRALGRRALVGRTGRAGAGGAEDKDEDAVGRVVGGEEVEGLARVF